MRFSTRGLVLVILTLYRGLLVRGASPKYVWPLIQTTGNAEVFEGVSQPPMGCQVGTGTTHPSLTAGALHFNGADQAFADLLVGTDPDFDNDFSLSFFINPQTPLTGTILHAKSVSAPGAVGELLEMVLEANATHLVWTMADVNGIFSSNAIIANPFVVDTWFPFAINYREGNGEIKLMTDGQDLLKLSEGSSSGRILGLPMTFRLARRQTDPPDPFLAAISCFSLYDSSANKDDFDNALDKCHPSNWQVTPTNTGFLTQTCSNLQGYFSRLAADERPVDAISPIVSMTVRSNVLCGQECIRQASCMSFTFSKTSQICALYGGFHSQLEAETATHYYRRRDLCC